MASCPEKESAVDRSVSAVARLAALARLELLDTPDEAVFDAITRLASVLLAAPSSFLSMVDADRDFYKSAIGFPVSLAKARELRGRTFCHYTLDRSEPLVISDTHSDPTWAAVPTVESLGVRAYVGVPLVIDGEVIGSLCVTDSKPREWSPIDIETLRELAKSAEREMSLRQRLKAAQADGKRLRALAKEKQQILAGVAHDLRNPLQVAIVLTDRLQRSADPATQRTGHRIHAAATSMKVMVDALLAEHADDGTEHSELLPVQVDRLLEDALETMSPICDRAGMVISIDGTSHVTLPLDYFQLLRSLGNLIGNSVKYCPAGSRIVLSAAVLPEGVSISVSDDGPGMSVGDLDRAFESGWQGIDGLARQDGAGLGLTIVRRLVAQNGGVVRIESTLGSGSTVTMLFPHLTKA